jgi:acyl-CoA synthetase (AMP-forming)/AMP-acid ligase II
MFMRYGEPYPAKYDLTTLKVIACAGEPLNPEAWRWAQTHLAGDGKWGYVIDNWWQTELGGPAIGTAPSMAMRPGKAGVAVPGCEADVLDEEGKSSAAGVGGQLVLKRPFPYMLRTVWRDPARYERDWQQIPGCYVTGDVAVKDKDGYITVLGRADDVLNVAGHRIGTAEVESWSPTPPSPKPPPSASPTLSRAKASKSSSKPAPITFLPQPSPPPSSSTSKGNSAPLRLPPLSSSSLRFRKRAAAKSSAAF